MSRIRTRLTLALILTTLCLALPVAAADLEEAIDRPGANIRSFDLPQPDPTLCQKACQDDPRCRAMTYVRPGVQGPVARCWLKHGIPQAKGNRCCVSWVKTTAGVIKAAPIQGQVMTPDRQAAPASQGAPVQAAPGGVAGAAPAKQPQMVNRFPSPGGAAGPVQMVPGAAALARERQVPFRSRQGFDFRGHTLRSLTLAEPNPALCQDECAKDPQCKGYTFVRAGIQGPQARCYLKKAIPQPTPSDCCTSGVRLPPEEAKVDPNSPAYKQAQQKSLAGQKALAQFDRDWASAIPPRVKDLNRRLQRAELNRAIHETGVLKSRFAKLAGIKKTVDPSQLQLKAEVKTLAQGGNSAVAGSGLQVNPQVLKGAMLAPKIEKLLVAPVQPFPDEVKEGGYVLLFGKNFGTSPGKVMLRYQIESKEFSGKPPEPRAVTLEPYNGSWHQAWLDTLVTAKIPIITDKHVMREATLVVWRDGPQAFKLEFPVRLIRHYPGVGHIEAAPAYGDHQNETCAVFNGTLLIRGRELGDQPGQIYLDLGQPVQGKQIWPLTPAKGGWAQSWTDHAIYVKVPALKGNEGYRTAQLVIIPAYNQNLRFMRPIPFGPRMVYAKISGKEFLELAGAPDNALEEKDEFLRVRHGPDCTWYRWFGSDGTDWFFRKKALPAHCKVVQAMVVPIEPDMAWATWKKALEELGDWVEALLSGGPVGFLKKWGQGMMVAIGSLFDPNVGRYGVNVTKRPDANSPIASVRWFTTCLSLSPQYDMSATYMASFVIEGPEGYCPGYIHNP